MQNNFKSQRIRSFYPHWTNFKKIPLSMQLFVFFMFYFITSAHAIDNYAQKTIINLNVHNAKVEDVLKEVEKQSEFGFFFNNRQIDINRKISIKMNNVDIFTALNEIFKGTDVKFTVLDRKIVLSILPQKENNPQQTTLRISGKVIDSNNEPIIGASVIEQGGGSGTITDLSGHFVLNVRSSNAVIEVTYVGYKKEITKVLVGTMMTITLKDDTKLLEEVVVVGYGTKKKVNLTSAVAAVSGKELIQTPVANLSNSIAGRMPGVIAVNSSGAPGSGSTLSIRGSSTLNNNSPLVVVDGIPYDSFNSFDPNEIESITVLKDGAAAAIYGARANNGVFLVTTKRGKIGKISINYSGTLSLQSPTMYPKPMNPYQYATATNQALDNAGYDRNNPAHASRYYKDEAIKKYQTGEDGANWYDESFKKTSLMQNHNVTVNGGSEFIKYFLSLALLNQDGMYDNINYKAYKFRSNMDIKLAKTLSLGVNLEGRQENQNSPTVPANTIFQHVSRANPTFKTYYPSGRPVNNASEHAIEEIRNSGYNRQLHNTFQGTLSLNWNLDGLTKGLSATANVSFGKYYNFGKAFNTPYTIYTEDAKGNITGSKTNGGNGGKTTLSETFKHSYSIFSNIGLNYQRTFGKHDISGLFVYEQNGAKGDEFSGTKQDFPVMSKDEFFASGPENQNLTGTSSINDARRAYVGRLSYAFDSKYLIEGSFRVDGSYKFPKGKKYGFFPSISAGWRISQEKFILENESLSFITNLKLRGSFAQVGNDKVNAFQYEDSYVISSTNGPFFNNAAQTLIYYGVYPNTNITWETADNFNIGIDGELWNGKLGFEFDYFEKNTRDILWSRVRSIPATFGRDLPNENYAKMRNHGFEVTLSHRNQINKVYYNLRLTGSYAKNKVTQIDDPANALDFQKQINRTLGFRSGYKALGLFQSKEEAKSWMNGQQFGVTSLAGDIKYADIDNNGIINSKDQTVLSNNNNTPKLMLGLTGDLSWKGFDLSFLLQGAAMRNIMLSMNSRVTLSDGSNSYAYLLDAWSPENKDAKYPLLWTGSRTINDRNSDFWLKDASYLRLKTITIGYTIPSLSIKQWGINSLRFYFSGQNLFTWSPLEGFDPEAGAGNGAYYPQQKLFSFGVNLNF